MSQGLLESIVLESQICNTTDSYSDDNKTVTDKQWGFTKGRSMEVIFSKLTEKWKQSVDNGIVFGVVFINFQKSFRDGFA